MRLFEEMTNNGPIGFPTSSFDFLSNKVVARRLVESHECIEDIGFSILIDAQ